MNPKRVNSKWAKRKPKTTKRKPSRHKVDFNRIFIKHWRETVNVPIVSEHAFHPQRKWRFDGAILKTKIAIEIQGYGRGHVSYMGMKSDYEKFNTALMDNWVVYLLMTADVQPENIDKTIKKILRLHAKRLEEMPPNGY